MTADTITKFGTIVLENTNGLSCNVPYWYDAALEKVVLFSSGKFSKRDVDRVMAFPNFVKAIVLLDIIENNARKSSKLCEPYHSPTADRLIYTLSGGR